MKMLMDNYCLRVCSHWEIKEVKVELFCDVSLQSGVKTIFEIFFLLKLSSDEFNKATYFEKETTELWT